MTFDEDLLEASEPSGRSEAFGSELGRSLVFALPWSSEVTARFGQPTFGGSALMFVAAFGCTALTLAGVGIVTRCQGTPGTSRVALGALLASGPAALLARVLQSRTHHRALGGVTFSLVALALVVAGNLVVRRLLETPAPGARRRSTLARVSLTTLVVVSSAIALGPLIHELGPSGTDWGRWVAQDLMIGLALSGLTAVLPWSRTTSPGAALAGATVWAASVIGGVVVVASNLPLRAILSEHAPIALGVLGAF
jgi:hypothetical protein